mgnify:CR=1 FL=1|jgi:DNA repair protein RecN (Recombination protein N)
MLRELSIRNLAVIENVNVSFRNGFHVMTGETGAGKSMLIDALSLVAGGRGGADIVRHGCDKAVIECQFDMPEGHPVWETMRHFGLDASPEEPIVIRREITAHGKSACRVNGQLVNLSMLKEIGEYLINIHGQHEYQSLLKTERHLEWLDLYGGKKLAAQKQAYRNVYQQYVGVRAALKQLEASTRQNMRMMDLYRFQIEEIETANPVVGEDESLAEEKRKLAHAEKRKLSAEAAYDAIMSGGLDAIGDAIAKLESIRTYDPNIVGPLLDQLQTAYYQAEDAAFQLRDYKDGIESDAERLAYIDDRLNLISGLKRKYGDSIPDILAYLDKIRNELDQIENREEHLDKLVKQEAMLYEEAVKLGRKLSEMRSAAADKLSSAVEQELKQLQMGKTMFVAKLEQTVSDERPQLGPNGLDEAVFLIAPNPGQPLKPLNKIASGGEMSRIMLALKSIFAEIDRVPVLVFDEVDTGVSGRAAQAIAEKMSALADRCQVFAITHLPQVACMADHHYEIIKTMKGGQTSTSVRPLAGQTRVEELARMLGGVEVTEKTRHHAQEMLDLAHRQKGA